MYAREMRRYFINAFQNKLAELFILQRIQI